MSRCVAATNAFTVSIPKGRRTIDHDAGIFGAKSAPSVLQPEMRVHLPHQPRLELCQCDTRRCNRQIRDRRRDDDVAIGPVGSAIASYMLRATWAMSRNDIVLFAWRIEIDEQRGFASERQAGREVDGGGGLADSALLVGNRDDHGPAGLDGADATRVVGPGGAGCQGPRGERGQQYYILYFPRSSGSRLSSHSV